METEIKKIFDTLRDLRFGLNVNGITDEQLFLEAIRLFGAQNKPAAVATATVNTQTEKTSSPDAPATDKQLFLLKKLGVPVPKDLTKREASKLIEAKKNEPSYEDY